MGELIFIASGKGGTGKSAVAVNMSAALAKEGKKVILVDMDMGQGNLDLYLGLQNSVVYNVYDVLTGLCTVQQGMLRDERFPCMYLMAAPPHAGDGKVSPKKIEHLYEVLKHSFDYVIVDGPSGVSENMTSAASGADRVLIVTTGDYAGIRGAEVAEMVLRKKGIHEISYILNRVSAAHTPELGYPSFEDIGRTLRGRVSGIIEESESMELSINRGIPAVMDGGSGLEDNMKRIAKRIAR